MINGVQREELKNILRELIIEELDRQLPLPASQEETHPSTNYVNVKELCELLQVSRQTIANWRRDGAINELITPFIEQQGRNVQYNAAGIQEVIKTHPQYFKRLNLLQPEQSSQLEEKRNEEYKRIYLRISRSEPITKSEKEFYLAECKRRGVASTLKSWHQVTK